MPQQFKKDPDEVLDYQVNWATWLGSDTIATSVWTVDSGITKVSDSNTTTDATVWVSGGSAGMRYSLANKVTTAGGRTAERTISIYIEQR